MRSIFLDWLRDRWGELIARNASTGEISLRTDPTTEDILVRKNPQIVTDAVSTGAGTTAETYFTVPDGRLWLVRFAGTSISTPENHYLDGRIYDGRYSYYGSVADNGGGFAGGHGGGRPSQLPGGGNEMMQRVGADCVRAVRRQVGGGSPSVIDVRHGENFMTVRVSVEGAQAPWICEHSSREVMRVYYGAEG